MVGGGEQGERGEGRWEGVRRGRELWWSGRGTGLYNVSGGREGKGGGREEGEGARVGWLRNWVSKGERACNSFNGEIVSVLLFL